MALMDLFKKKKKEAPESPAGPPGMPPPTQVPPTMPSEVPISQVVSMQAQGLSNNQIIQSLQQQGFTPQQIYDALAQAEAKRSIAPMKEQGGPSPFEPSMPERPAHPPSEEVAEQIIEEKWRELQKELKKVTDWRDQMSSRMDKMEQSVTDLKTDLDGLHKAIVSRIGEYDKTLMDVGTEIKAMEKVFQKVLPELTSNVQELSRMTKKSPASTKK